MSTIETDEDKIVTMLVRPVKKLFPRGDLCAGDFGIVVCEIDEVLEGQLHSGVKNNITIKGTLNGFTPNEQIKTICKQVETKDYGIQYEPIYYNSNVDLKDKDSQRIFLKSILTETQVDNLYTTFSNPIEILEQGDMEALCKVKGIGVSVANKMIKKYQANKDYSKAFVELDKLGLTPNMIKKLTDAYGGADTLLGKLKADPYILIEDVDGVGWEKADAIARGMGYGEYSLPRVKAYIKYYLGSRANEEGDTWVDPEDLMVALEDVLGEDLPQDTLSQALKELADADIIWTNEDRTMVALYKYYKLESYISNSIVKLIKAPVTPPKDGWEERVKKQEKKQGWDFTDQQMDGIKSVLENNVTVITGGAGVGKTSTVVGALSALNAIYDPDICDPTTFTDSEGVFEYVERPLMAQCALSGKASVNLTEATGMEGHTIHRLLGYKPRLGFMYDHKNKMPYDIVIVDEVSMIGIDLFNCLIRAIKEGTRLILLGDTGQLDAIGAGNVLYDIIESGAVNVVTLTEIHRQAKKSAIITDSLKIAKGTQITESVQEGVETRGELKDLTLDIYNDKVFTAPKMIEYFKALYPETPNIMDLQIVIPTKERGRACAYQINKEIQSWIRSLKNTGLVKGSNQKLSIKPNSDYPYEIYVGDKVINLKNNYETVSPSQAENMQIIGDEIHEGGTTPIMNGNMGIVKSIDETKGTMIVDFEMIGEVLIDRAQAEYINLGYAITVHKSQGSGFKKLICGIDFSHFKQCNRGMVYTMVTRAKQLCILCAQNKALRYSISHSNANTKNTFLATFLERGMK